MPKDTFFRLSEEKKQRIQDAAFEEFCRVPYSQASINKIIKAAEIPRGSFYQYFVDKEDLFVYLISLKSEEVSEALCKILRAEQGDLFRFLDKIIEKFEKFYQSQKFGEVMMFFSDQRAFHLQEFPKDDCLMTDIKTRFDQNLIHLIDFDLLKVEEEEKTILMNIISAIFHNSAVGLMHMKQPKPDRVIKELKKQLGSLERHYRK